MKNFLPFLLLAAGAAFAQELRPVVAIGAITAKDSRDAASAIRSALTTEFTKSGRFVMLERKGLETLMTEQAIGKTGGLLQGADYALFADITKASSRTVKVDALLGSGSSDTAELSLDIRLVDVRTSRIVYTESVDQNLIGNKQAEVLGFSGKSQKADVFADLVKTVALEQVQKISETIFPIRIISAKGRAVVLNYGESLLAPGTVLNIYAVGDPIIDPDTKEVLSQERTLVDQAVVEKVEKKVSRGWLVKNNPEIASAKEVLAEVVKNKKGEPKIDTAALKKAAKLGAAGK